jgi:putative transposase
MTAYPTDVCDEAWVVLGPVLTASGKTGRKHGNLRGVVNALLYRAHTGCQWRFLPSEFGPWTRAWSQFRRWSRNGTWARALAGLYAHARTELGRAETEASLVVIDTHLGRGASNGGATFHDRGGPYGLPTHERLARPMGLSEAREPGKRWHGRSDGSRPD